MDKLLKIRHFQWILPIVLIVILAALTYLPYVHQFHYYGDDWPVEWAGFTGGPARIAELYTGDRPFLGLVHAFNYSILGDNPLPWNYYAVFTRILGGILVFWLLQLIWPNKRIATTSMAVLYTLYPGFLSMPNASMYQTQIFGGNMGLFSLIFTLLSLKSKQHWSKTGLTLAACVFALANVLTYEWMIGVEGIRFILLWYMLQKEKKRPFLPQLGVTLKAMIPYILVIGGYLFWRFFIFTNKRRATNINNIIPLWVEMPTYTLVKTIMEWIKGVIIGIFAAWIVPLYRSMVPMRYTNLIIMFALSIAGIGIHFGGMFLLKKSNPKGEDDKEPKGDQNWAQEAMLIGFLITVVATFPPIFFDRYITLGTLLERYLVPAMLGILMLIGGFIFSLKNSFIFKTCLVCVLIGLSILTHIGNAQDWAKMYATRIDFWWQFNWRVPDLEDETVVIPYLASRNWYDDFDIWPQLNMIYRPGVNKMTIFAHLLNSQTAIPIILQDSDKREFKGLDFFRDYRNVVLFNFGYPSGEPSCLRAIDGQQIELSAKENPLIPLVAEYSHLDKIIAEGKDHPLPEEVFGPEPDHEWCYYYEKADLARQKGDWEKIIRLGEEAAEKGFAPYDRIEWMPFLEAYANLGQQEKVIELAEMVKPDYTAAINVCKRFESPEQMPDTYLDIEAFTSVQSALCP